MVPLAKQEEEANSMADEIDITLHKAKYRERKMTRVIEKKGGHAVKKTKGLEEGRPSRRKSYPHAFSKESV